MSTCCVPWAIESHRVADSQLRTTLLKCHAVVCDVIYVGSNVQSDCDLEEAFGLEGVGAQLVRVDIKYGPMHDIASPAVRDVVAAAAHTTSDASAL